MTVLKAICCMIVLLVVGFIWACSGNLNSGSNNANGGNNTAPAAALASGVTPAPFPNPGIPGFNFPEKEAVIDGWTKDGKDAEIYNHGWGIWAGLTTPTTQTPSGGKRPLLVFETWLTPDEMIAAMTATEKLAPSRPAKIKLSKPHQFLHALEKGDKSFELSDTDSTGGNTNSARGNTNSRGGNTNPRPDTGIAVSVSYSPPAAQHAIDNKLFLWETLKGYGDKGLKDIPAFPSDSITIKPVFKVIQKSKLDSSGLYVMPSWHGPIDTVAPYPQKAWRSCIYVDPNNNGKGDGSQDMTCSAPTPATTYNVNDFINYTLNQQDADFYNQEFNTNAAAGDIAILVGMHVTSRETLKWTWQSFYWVPNPQDPKSPSSPEIAKARPSQITGAAAHYGMAIAYAMVFPVQPDVGGKSVGNTVYGYNPYLESGFGPSVFTGSNSFVVNNKGVKVMTDAGVRTNCMSCHIYASVSAKDPCQSAGIYSGDAYVGLDDPAFKDQLRLDFAWSVQGNIQKDGKPCPQ